MTLRTVTLPILAAMAVTTLCATAQGQLAPPVAPVVTEKTTSEATGPSMAMVGSGVVIFGVSYLPVVVVGATSGLEADHTLFVPIAGPWIDFAQRPGCSPAAQCNGENTDRVLLAVDGVLQGVGALTIVGGLLTTAHETTTVRTARALDAPKLRLAPARLASGAYGVVAAGAF
ncbi:MAG TPA: hypothetical protein VKU41_14220 [Polyangiaceae bacterium]|nr:hypothetical protein [Polyangiaceae bacterium]